MHTHIDLMIWELWALARMGYLLTFCLFNSTLSVYHAEHCMLARAGQKTVCQCALLLISIGVTFPNMYSLDFDHQLTLQHTQHHCYC